LVDARPVVGLVSNAEVRREYIADADLARLNQFADIRWKELNEPSSWDEASEASPATRAELADFARGVDALVVCHGSPRIGDEILAAARRVTFVGELEGDRFARRIDVEAANARGVRAIDTTHGSSYPVSEWALALILIGLRNGGAHFRKLAAGETWGTAKQRQTEPEFAMNEELTGKTVGLIGGGYIARRLIEFLRPFRTTNLVYDPYISVDLAYAYDFTLTSLDKVMSQADVVVCLVPITHGTRGMIGRHELSLLRPSSVFVNVSRGAVVQTDALIERLDAGDINACLDVFDPEPIPPDSPVRTMPNVFLSPHIAGTTQRSRTRFFEEMVGELQRHFSGHQTLFDLTSRTMANRIGE
jgi:phosphoglycerate dehydrogenase-like enzyme